LKLNTTQVERIRTETGIYPIPDTEPSYNTLEDSFGEHTFYVDPIGLYVFETCEDTEMGRKQVRAHQIASWTDDEMTTLQVQPPQATGTVVVLDVIH